MPQALYLHRPLVLVVCVGRSVVRSVGRSVGRSVVRSVGRSLAPAVIGCCERNLRQNLNIKKKQLLLLLLLLLLLRLWILSYSRKYRFFLEIH